ncbi:hypothetical protein GLYMA_02G297501v4 [Glycine max]|uniref:uncharacterized protein LOC114402950 n=1 Tax=Glycine soja TaxID=3848 RepID=UPI00023BC9C6|nr:uncharacterized protein LOC114402950 [Glycine soja]KAG4402870.1 hypothetical protein GLYMA_02G297501v4 [Glycine max]
MVGCDDEERHSVPKCECATRDGPIAKELIPKLTIVRRNLSSKLGVAILDIDVQPVIASTILLKRVGGILFVLGSTFGSYLLSTTLCGALLFFYKDEGLDYQKTNQEEDPKSKDNLEIRKRYV